MIEFDTDRNFDLLDDTIVSNMFQGIIRKGYYCGHGDGQGNGADFFYSRIYSRNMNGYVFGTGLVD